MKLSLHGYTCILNRKLINLKLNAKQDNFDFCSLLFDTIVYSKIFLNCDVQYYVLSNCETETKTNLSTKNFTYNFSTYIFCWIDRHCFWLVIFIYLLIKTRVKYYSSKWKKKTIYYVQLFPTLTLCKCNILYKISINMMYGK